MSQTDATATYRHADSPPQASPRSSIQSELWVLCAAVGFERFSFYLLSTLLVLYLNEERGVPAAWAVEIYGYFLCVSYLTPLIGGRLCDGRMGGFRTALVGCVVQVIGYTVIFTDHAVALYSALALLALGSGLFKAATQTLLSNLYAPDDARRDRGFNIFYASVNIGALVAPLIGGFTQRQGGSAWSFAFAGIGVAVSVCVLAMGHSRLDQDSQVAPVSISALRKPVWAPSYQLALILVAGALFSITSVQSHSTLLLWARDRTERQLGTFEIPVVWFGAAPAALVLLVAPALMAIFSLLRRRRREPTTGRKIALGLVISFLAFIPLWAAPLFNKEGLRVSPAWLLACMTLLAAGELLVPALAPSEITRMVPPDHKGTWLGYWFVVLALGHAIGGWVQF